MPKGPVFFIFLTVILWGVSGFIDKLTMRYLGGNETFVLRMGVNTLLSLALFLWGWTSAKAAIVQAGGRPVVLVTVSLVLTLAAVFCYIRALFAEEASRIVPMSSAFPLVTFLLALIFLGEKFTWTKIIGTVLVCVGMGVLAL